MIIGMSAIGTKRTWSAALHMSAFDPWRTSTDIKQPGRIWSECLTHLGSSGSNVYLY
jgi:hypothetical protein